MNKALSVSRVISQIKSTLEGDFKNIVIEGEISNFSASSSGHYYFSLKDNNSMLSCALFRGMAIRNPFIRQVKDGLKVQVYGDISVYNKRGTFQLIVKKIVHLGAGDLKQRFEALKKKLSGEGLFEIERKISIPSLPRKIGVVTALGADALQDFLNIIDRRSHSMEIVISPSLVQGDAAAMNVITALEKLKSVEGIDVVVLTRGGGSMEDLWTFNDEKLVRYLATYDLPIVSAVGHHVDFTLCDYVADKRLETPSAAAEFLSTTQVQLVDKLVFLKKQLYNGIESKVQFSKGKLMRAKPLKIISLLQQKVFKLDKQVELNRGTIVTKISNHLNPLYLNLDQSITQIETSIKKKVEVKQRQNSEISHFLRAVNPNQVLKRGYSYAEVDGEIIARRSDLEKLASDKVIDLVFHDGVVGVKKC